MEGKRLILDDRHAVRQHKVFAIVVVLGLLIVLAVWIVQVRMALDRGALAEVRNGISNFSETWQEQWNNAQGTPTEDAVVPPTDDTPTALETAVSDALEEQAAKDALGGEMVDVLNPETPTE